MLNEKILSAHSIQSMFTPQVRMEENGSAYGLGVWLDMQNGTVTKIHVIGADPGVSFRSAYYPNSKAVCTVLCNRDKGSYMVLKALEETLSAVIK